MTLEQPLSFFLYFWLTLRQKPMHFRREAQHKLKRIVCTMRIKHGLKFRALSFCSLTAEK
ncbi:hypothetical protein BH10PSE6_BH10PSE6_35220 [soil metagenome]